MFLVSSFDLFMYHVVNVVIMICSCSYHFSSYGPMICNLCLKLGGSTNMIHVQLDYLKV